MLLRFVSGHYHLWYLPFLWGVYLAIPFLQKLAADRTLSRQLLFLSLVIGVGIPWLGDLAVLCFPDWSGVIGSLKNSLHYTFFFDLLAVVLLGHELNTVQLNNMQRRLLYLSGILGAALTFPLTLWASARTGSPNPIFCQITAPTTLCAAAALFVFAKHHLTRLPGMVEWMAKRSFGIYLSHVLVLEVLQAQGLHVLAANPIWTIPVLAAAVFALSLMLTELLRRVPFVGKILV
jgi:surface polysaccharide O-acyltransferase-like enzyme